ncbi:MAG: hypothetical protein AAF192_21415 [Pseudomonadota bacterium]
MTASGMEAKTTLALKVAAGLWVLWGLVHMLAGAVVLSSDAAGAVAAVADAATPEALAGARYPDAAGALLNQHGWNLAWFGAATLIGAVWIWRGSLTGAWVTALIGGMADLGYFLFMDLGGHVHFLPGTVMTLVSGSAIVLSAWVWRRGGFRTA